MKNKIVILTGAGISAESGLDTFRGQGGLWEGQDVKKIAHINSWHTNRRQMLDFYNARRRALTNSKPNIAHLLLAKMENEYDVQIITQNVDDLHERAGSSKVLHLHGELKKAQSTVDKNLIYDWNKDIIIGDKCEKGSQLRPFIVWFGEAVPELQKAIPMILQAELLVVIGTSLNVYPAASLIDYANENARKFIIDPNIPEITKGFHKIEKPASKGVKELITILNKN